VQAYKINGREFTKLDIGWMGRRMDMLRAQVARQTNGGAFVARFRDPE
jgi:hypothetical protein